MISTLHRGVAVSRRQLLVDLGRLTLGAVVLGSAAAACSRGRAGGGAASDAPSGGGATAASTEPPTSAGSATPTPAASDRTASGQMSWARVDLDFVSAYVLARDGELAIIDTGVSGSEGAIEAVVAELGGRWSDVGHVILTHRHPDHAGSVQAVLEAAADATAYAGAADVPAIPAPRDITPIADGDRVMGLEVIATPGHTAGHVCVLDPAGSVLFAGDALNGEGGGVAGPNPSFSDDLDAAWESVRKIGERTFDTVVFGHGDPVTAEASAHIAALRRP